VFYQAFVLDGETGTLRCPSAVVLPIPPRETVRFPAETCAGCALRERCTRTPQGRSVTIHPEERLLVGLPGRQTTPAGRAKPRERFAVEHTLAHVGRWQGWRALSRRAQEPAGLGAGGRRA
jgi:hypothetical protein